MIREQILDLVERNPDLRGHRRERVLATMDLAEARQPAYAVVDEGIAHMERCGERHFEAELHRLRGELRDASGDVAGAEEDLRQALRSARSRGARSNELLAATSLVRLLQRKGQREEARELLQGSCDHHADADDLPEAREAHALLATLS